MNRVRRSFVALCSALTFGWTVTAHAAVSPFGLSQNASISGYATWFPELEEAGVKEFRYFIEWRGIEPANDTYAFTNADAFVASATAGGIKISGFLGYSPTWTASSHHGFPMDNLADWAEYVGAVVGRYDGSAQPAVDYWEVWNEPNASAFNAGNRPASDYATLVRTAYTAAKSANPSCKIGITVANFDVRYIKQVLESLADQGAAGSFDFIAVHPYELVDRMNAPDGELQYLNIVPVLRDMLEQHAPAKADVPIRFTELGARIGSSVEGETVTPQLAAQLLVKSYVLGIVQGAEQICWFEAKDPTATTSSGAYGFGVMDVSLNKRPGWFAYKAMTDAMGANPDYKGWLALGPDNWGYGLVFGNGSANVMAAWMPKGESATINFGATVQIVDIYTNTTTSATSMTLTDKPVIVRNLPASWAMQAATNKPLPYPWGSAPLNSNLASIELGEVSLASGIELDRAHTVVANGTGTNGVIVNQPGSGGGAYFSVSPSFAGFGTADMYVRVTAHQTALRTSGYSGMNLFYQPISGSGTAAPQYPYENLGQWKSLPNDTASHTFTWHLTDAMFAQTFGHGFYLQFDASVPFVIDKVEISKDGDFTPPAQLFYEAEDLDYTASKTVTTYGHATSSGGYWDHLAATVIGDHVSYTVPVAEAGTYTVRLRYKANTNRGIFQLDVNGTDVGAPHSQYGYTGDAEVDVGNVTITAAGDQTFRFTVTGKAGSSAGYGLSFDSIRLTKLPAPPAVLYEAEDLVYAASKTVTTYSHATSSGGYWDHLAATVIGDHVSYTVPVAEAGTYTVRLRYKANTNRGIFQLDVNGTDVGAPHSQYGSTGDAEVDVGNVTITAAGDQTFRFTVTGKAGSSAGYGLSFDSIRLTKQ